ncbi:MAG: protein translocase subunit SecD, partial [Solirubrobacteraceae bacterium]|nr:protein translocase subunit SecD [Solirubrobacteraceae bacterium]
MQNKTRNLAILLLVGVLLAGAIAVIVAKPTRLGLDLKGGVELIYEAKPTKQSEVTPEAINRAIDIMRERVDQFGVAEPEIQRFGGQQIQVSLPDVQNAERAQQQVGRVAQLFFYDWEPNVMGPGCRPDPTNAQVTGGPQAGNPTYGISLYEAVRRAAQCPARNPDSATHEGRWYLLDTKNEKVVAGPEEKREDLFVDLPYTEPQEGQEVVEVKPGTVIVRAESPDSDDENATKPDRWYVLNDDPALLGTDIKDPEQNFDNGPGGTGAPIVTFDFTKRGRDIWQQVTREIAQRGQANQVPGADPLASAQHFAIVLDDELISVPYIDYQQNPDGIDGANGSQIQGGFTIQSAQNLADLLRTGALPIKLELISQSQVSATLGQQALDEGLIAGIVGFVVVALFLIVFYRVLGLIAVGALVIYGVYFFALIKLIPITLTLPGIAGLILTLSVAADANIVIFERVKEEIRAGRSIPAGIAQGYKKGLAAIIDANVVTFMVAFILFMLATAGVKGFAFTLGVGTAVSLFTAVLATQAVLGTMGNSRLLASRSALGATEQKVRIRFDFMGYSKWFFSASGVILVICALAIGGKGLNFGIDFESGTRITTELAQKTDENGVRDAIAALGYKNAEVQKVTNDELGDNAFQISGDIAPEDVQKVRQALDEDFGGTPNFTNESIGPTFGESVARSAVIAIIASLLVISVYIALRFEWKYAVPVLIAVTHDLLITAGIYALLGLEVTTSTVAALLTILGFSLYDTIIVFDRIRENAPRMPRAAFSQIVNRSMSEVIVRSLATSFCTLLPVLSLLLFGGETLQDFAMALLIGTASGTYSSIFIAGQVLTHWKQREPAYQARAKRILETQGYIPAYPTPVDGAPVEVEPQRRRRRWRSGPAVPGQPPEVSREEFEELVADIQDTAAETSATAAAPRPRKPTRVPRRPDAVQPEAHDAPAPPPPPPQLCLI